MKKIISSLLACLLVIVIVSQVSQGTAMAYNFSQGYVHNNPLWTLNRLQFYPNSVHTTGQTTRVYAVWLGTQTLGNGQPWVLVSKDPQNNQLIDTRHLSTYTHVAIVFSHRNNASRTHFLNGAVVSNATTVMGSEVYDSSGRRITTTGFVEFSGGNVVIPLNMSISTNIYTLSAGTQEFTVRLQR